MPGGVHQVGAIFHGLSGMAGPQAVAADEVGSDADVEASALEHRALGIGARAAVARMRPSRKEGLPQVFT
ncbi:hypothetical protein [Azospirillum palustre]